MTTHPHRRQTDRTSFRLLPYIAYALLALGTIYAVVQQELIRRAHDANLQHQIDKTNQLATQVTRGRRERLRDIRDADRKLCESVNRITARDRRSVARGPQDLRALLALMGTPQATIDRLVAADRRSVARELRQRPIIPCNHLPTRTLGASK